MLNPKDKIDNLITRATEANINEGLSKEIHLDEEWVKFKRKYFPRKSYFHLQKSIAVMLPVLFGIGFILSLLFPVQARAISSKSLEFFKSFLAGKVQNVGVDFANKSYTDKSINSLSPDIIEKIQSAPFKILLPADYLDVYQIDSITVDKFGDSVDVLIELTADNDRKVVVQQTKITQGFGQGLSFDDEDAVSRNIRVNGQEATLVTCKNQRVSLTWIDGEVYVSMDGNIGEDEMIQLGSSMRKVP